MSNVSRNFRKNIIIFTGALSSGGTEKQSILLAKALNLNYDVLIISYFGERELNRYINFLNDEDITYFQLKGNVIQKIIKFIHLLKMNKPDIIINFLPSNNVIGGFFAKIFGVNLILGGVRSSRQSFVKFFELLTSHHLFDDITVFNNSSGLDYFTKKGFNKKKSIMIPNCIFPIPDKTVRAKRLNSEVRILIVSRFESYKDYNTAIKTISKIIHSSPKFDIKLDIVGVGSQENLIREWLIEFEITEFTTVTINPENIFYYYEMADIFLQTSLFEGMSNSIMEAMAYSLPIVATNVGDNATLIKEQQNGFLAPIGDVNGLSNNLLRLIKNIELREKMGNKSYEMIRKDYSIDKFSDNFIKLFKY